MATIFGCIINCPQVPTIFPCTNPKKMQNRLIFSLPLRPNWFFSLVSAFFGGLFGGHHHQKPKWKTGHFAATSLQGGDLGFSVGLFTGLAVLCIVTLIARCAAFFGFFRLRGRRFCWGYEWSFPTWQWKQNRWDDFRWQVNFCWRFLLFFFWWPEWLAFQCLIGCHFYGPLCHTHRGVSFFRVSLGLRLG